jgi:hypothetical protein
MVLHGGDRPTLQDPELPALNGPFDVLRSAETALEAQPHLAEPLEIRARDRWSAPFSFGNPALSGASCKRVVDDGDVLHADHLTNDRAARAIDDVVVGRNETGHDPFAQSQHRLDHHVVASFTDGIDREQHAARIGDHHLLHDHGDRQIAKVTLVTPVEEGSRREERRPALPDAVDDGVGAKDAEERVVLAGEAGAIAVLTDRARPDGDQRARSSTAEGSGLAKMNSRIAVAASATDSARPGSSSAIS